MHLNLANSDEDRGDKPADAAHARELTALASIVEFAIVTAESTGSHEALAYLRNVAEIVRSDLAKS